MYHADFDYGLGRERVVQLRKEVEHNRLESSLAKAAHLREKPVPRRGIVVRGAAYLSALFR